MLGTFGDFYEYTCVSMDQVGDLSDNIRKIQKTFNK